MRVCVRVRVYVCVCVCVLGGGGWGAAALITMVETCLTLAPGSDRIPVELLQILTQYAICRLPAETICSKPISCQVLG